MMMCANGFGAFRWLQEKRIKGNNDNVKKDIRNCFK